MQQFLILAIAFITFGALDTHAAWAAETVVGVNLEDIGHMNEQQQDALLEQLQQSGVKTIRTGMLNQGMLDPKFACFITGAFKRGIETVLILFPKQGGLDKHTAPANPPLGRKWPILALSDSNPDGFRTWLTPQFAAMEAAGVRFAAFELGNELNTTGYNGDIPLPGTGRILGISDLNNRADTEGRSISAGYKAYLKILAVLKDARDHSKLNRTTPILSGMSANWGMPGPLKSINADAVSVPDSIEFLRQNGMDKLVDCYAVHFYPSGDPQQSISARDAVIERNGIFAACRQGAKPCWLTEWNINNANKSCPIHDEQRMQVVQNERKAFQQFIEQGRLAAVIWYSWDGDYVGEKENQGAIFRCGALTDAGQLALSPM